MTQTKLEPCLRGDDNEIGADKKGVSVLRDGFVGVLGENRVIVAVIAFGIQLVQP